MKKKAIKFFAEYFKMNENDVKECYHMTIDCMVKFTEKQIFANTKNKLKAKTN